MNNKPKLERDAGRKKKKTLIGKKDYLNLKAKRVDSSLDKMFAKMRAAIKISLLILIATSSFASDPYQDMRQQHQHDEIVAQMKEANVLARRQLENFDSLDRSPLDLSMPLPINNCTYALIKKGSGYETYTFPDGRIVNVYVRMCDGVVQ